MTSTTDTAAPTVLLTPTAATKVAELLAAETGDLALRVAVMPGGCSGLRYELFFDDQPLPGDIETVYDGVRVVVDEQSAPFLAGATIDYTDNGTEQGFTIDNPAAGCACGGSGCGCGCGDAACGC